MTPARGTVLVRRVATEETIPGGSIVLTQNTRDDMASDQCEVVAVGPPDACEDEDCARGGHSVPHFLDDRIWRWHYYDSRLVPGAWVIVSPRSLVDTGQEGERLYLVRQDDVLAVFLSQNV